jgi:hypothetical protein
VRACIFVFTFTLGVDLPEANDPAKPAETAQIINIVSQTGGDLILQPVVKYTPKKRPRARRRASKFTFIVCIIQVFFSQHSEMITCCKSTPTPYVKLKKNLRRNTLLAGTALVTCNTLTGDTTAGISTAVGVVTSLTYLNLLINHVDTIENSDSIQKHIATPVGVAIFESWWNHNFQEYTLSPGYTFVGFLSYQFALMTILYETVTEMLTQTPPEKERGRTPSSYESPSTPSSSLGCTYTDTHLPGQTDQAHPGGQAHPGDQAHPEDHEQA